MDARRLYRKVDRETNKVLEGVSPSKVLAWGLAAGALALLTVWLTALADGEKVLSMTELLAGVTALGALAVGLWTRPGDVVDAALDRLKD